MAKFYALGNYTAQGFSGFCKDPKSDRSKAAQVAADAVGAKLVSLGKRILRTETAAIAVMTSIIYHYGDFRD